MLLNIVSHDPGKSLGCAFLDVDTETKLVVARDAMTADLDKLIENYHPELLSSHGKLLARTFMVNKIVGKYCDAWEPDFLVHETAFSAHGRKGFGNAVEAFASLRENILAIKLAAMNYDITLPIKPINPSTVKYAVMGDKSSDKSEIKSGLLALPDLTITFDTQHLDQHGWDAIAIGYTFIKKQILGVPKHEHLKRNKRAKRNKTKGA